MNGVLAEVEVREPLVAPVDLRRGWTEADGPRRTFVALGALVLPVVVIGSNTDSWPPVLLAVVLGPPVCYSIARVLRPHRRGGEELVRHWMAAIAVALSMPFLSDLALQPWWQDHSTQGHGFESVLVLGIPAALLGAVSVLWGLVVLTLRFGRRLAVGDATVEEGA